MFRLAMLCALVAPTLSAAPDDKKDAPKEPAKELAPFQGTWKVLRAEGGGKGAPPLKEEVRITFAGNKMTMQEGKFPPQEGTFSVDPTKDPAEIDMNSGMNPKVPGIYKFEKDGRLSLSFFVRKATPQRPKKFGEGDAVVLVLEKTKEKSEPRKEIGKDQTPFQGAWKVTKMEFGGKDAPGGTPEDMRFTFAGDKLTVTEGKTPPQNGTFAINAKTEPGEIDYVNSSNQRIQGIYKFDQDGKLTICTAVTPGGKRPFKFGDPDTVQFTLEKQK
jgi:uncharacterized protein (TIGR03067 family)